MEYRSFDGLGNNPDAVATNAAGTGFIRIGTARYADGISVPVGGPNPRAISNLVVGEGEAGIPNALGISGMIYAWGQFIDHDLTRASGDGVTRIDIAIPEGDPVFAPGSSIALTRARQAEGTGAGTGTPAIAVNAVTGWLDASMVYGSDAATAAGLRLADGHMATSAGANLPLGGGGFLAGDVRAMENPSLTALQTLFIREHNWQVDRLAAETPALDGEALYQQARAIVGAEIAHITYTEFLPLLVGALPAYAGYDPGVDARLSVEFTGAAYRWGHSTVSAETERVDEWGGVTGPALTLRDTFFLMPEAFAADGGAGGFLRHLGADLAQAMDARIVDDLRNFLFDPPVGQDLAAINIQRGRDLGLGTLNETRIALGLAPHADFEAITDDAGTVAGLRAAFGSVDAVDLWTGGLAEAAAPGVLLGETFGRILVDQFLALRDGDRFWYQNQGFDAGTLAGIEATTLSEIILRTTDTRYIQPEVFLYAERRAPEAEAETPEAPQLVIGGAAAETLLGSDQGDWLVGGGGADRLYGGAGDDRYEVAGQAALVFEAVDAGWDEVTAAEGFYLYAGIEALVLAEAAGAAHGVGNALDNRVAGNAAANLLLGGAGDDTLLGAGGDDRLFGEAGNDRLEAGYGVDVLVGGAGDDRYFVDGQEDLIFEAEGGGDDLVNAAVGAGPEAAYYLFAGLEGLRLGGGAAAWGVGNGLDNYLEGNGAANWLLGGAGADTLDGDAGDDVLFGQAGADVFALRPGAGADLVADFAPGEDRIDLSAFGFAGFDAVVAAMREVAGETAIDLPGGDLLVLAGVANAALGAADVILA